MKYLLLNCLLFIFFTGSIKAQEATNSPRFVKFEEVEITPRFEGCDQESTIECTKTNLLEFIKNKFKNNKLSDSIPEKEKVGLIKFFIDSDGKVIRPYVISRNEEFKKALISILNSLPNFTPGLNENEPVIITFELPINLSTQATIPIFRYDDETLSSHAILKKCRNKKDSKSCTFEFIKNRVMRSSNNSKLKLPKNIFISAMIKFVVNENGMVSQILVEGSYAIFNNDLKRIIGELPKFDPATVDGKPVQELFQMPVKLMMSN